MESTARRRLVRRLRILAWRTRRLVAVAVILIAAVAVIDIVRPTPPAQTPIVVAAHALSAGTALTAADLTVFLVDAPAPQWSLPGGELDTAIGHSVMAPLSGGAPVMTSQLLSSSIVDDYPMGTVLVPVHFDAATAAAIIEPGRTIDVYAAAAGAESTLASRVARHATVVMVTTEDAAGGLLASNGTGFVTVVLAVGENEASGLLGTGHSGFATLYPVLLQ